MAVKTPIIAIIGMGSRGLSVLEQLIGQSRHAEQQALQIEVFDPQTPGSGLHHAQQPDYLMLNTIAGQLSAFSAAFPACEPSGRTFLQWCHAEKVRLDERGHTSKDGQGRPVAFGDFVPRALLGRYLQYSYRFLLQHCPAHVQVRYHAEQVITCRSRPDAAGFRLSSVSQARDVDAVFLTGGHASETVGHQTVGETVGIEGLGLTAMDTLARLTQGRGGRYVRDAGFTGWRYLPSGREPRVFLYSRSGLPFHARPQWYPSGHAALPRLFFNAAAIDCLREQKRGGKLDFQTDVLPMIKDEMRAVFYQARVRLDAPRQLESVQNMLREAVSRPALFARLAKQWGAFDPDDWLTTRRWSGEAGTYGQWFAEWIRQDLALSRLGTAHSPIRQALEVWRDYRDLLRRVADRNGLTEASTQAFYGVWAGLSNRLVGGPQKERHEDLLALIDAGVVTVLAPMDDAQRAERRFDSVICARVAGSGLSGPCSDVINDLHEHGLIRPAHAWPADGIDTDPAGRVIGREGHAQSRLWALGPAVEGCTFYNHYVPTPDPACRALIEAHEAVKTCLETLADRS
ncbi:FAD/NAD(P)-binding protein [Pseudomonas syringae]|uniref:FAD/NAD(P)-binding protein n=1 Tax=Pseudomonas syringae TaxID=317 RepID=UPI000C7A8F49|nr:FAD/NAD(P)-binding domain-containing protein [Pseudomonas syringae]